MSLTIESMGDLRRDRFCGTFRREYAVKETVFCGWIQRQRDLGQLIFCDLRDRTGIVQLAFDDNTDRAVFDKAFQLRSEYVVMARGVVRIRSSINRMPPSARRH